MTPQAQFVQQIRRLDKVFLGTPQQQNKSQTAVKEAWITKSFCF
jgi:hypothetical protein